MIFDKEKYCVYLTSYSGSKLPQFYIGSTTINKVNSGYHGSVKSKKYADIYNYEISNNRHLFKTIIVAKYFSRKKALYRERHFQKSLNVVRSDMYINMSLAKNFGWFGMSTRKEDSPVYGKRWKKTQVQIENSRKSLIAVFSTPEYSKKLSEMRKGKLSYSKDKLLEVQALYKKIIELYNSKPDLVYGYTAKNGKVMTYERAFAKTFAIVFSITSNGLHNIITKNSIIKRSI